MNGLATDITVAAIGVGLLSVGLLIAGFRWDRHTERPKPVGIGTDRVPEAPTAAPVDR